MRLLIDFFAQGRGLAIALGLALLLTPVCHAGYQIQDDCLLVRIHPKAEPGSHEQQRFLHDAFGHAKSISLMALSHLSHLEGQQADLYTWMFGPDRRRADVMSTFHQLTRLTTPKDGAMDGEDVRVYCSTKRLKRKTVEGTHWPYKLYDPDTNTYHKMTELFQCDYNTLAFTLVPPEQHGEASSISFCPWYLNYEQRKAHKFLAHPLFNHIADLFAKFRTGEWGVPLGRAAEIDYLKLFDTTIIHELTHTRPADQTDDIKYGWKGCREIATVEGDAREDNGPRWNADSYGLYATAAWYINFGGTVFEDGRIRSGGDDGVPDTV